MRSRCSVADENVVVVRDSLEVKCVTSRVVEQIIQKFVLEEDRGQSTEKEKENRAYALNIQSV